MAMTWKEVEKHPDYLNADSDTREAMRNGYFEDVVAPQIETNSLQAARAEFDVDTKPSAVSRGIDAVKGGIDFATEVYDDAQKREDARVKQESYSRSNVARPVSDTASFRTPLENKINQESLAATKKYESGPIEAISEVVRQGYAGATIDAPAAVNKAGQAFSPEDSAAEDFFKQGAAYWESNKAEFEPSTRNKGDFTKFTAAGARAIPLSGTAMATAGISMLSGSVAAPVVAASGIAALFGGSAYTDTLEAGLARGIPKEEAKKAAWLTGVIEGVGETLGDYVGGKFLVGLGKSFAQKLSTQGAVAAVTSPRWAAKFGKDFMGNMAVQAGTEAGQGFGQTAVENRYGISDESPIHVAKEGALTAVAMSGLMAPGAVVGHKRQADIRKFAGDLLEDANAPIEERAKAAEFVRKEMEPHIGADAAKQWHESMVATLGLDKLNGVNPANVPAGAARAEDVLGTPESPDPYPNAKPGSLSSAANIAAKNGIAPIIQPEVSNAQVQPGAANKQPNIGTAGSNTNILQSPTGNSGENAGVGNGLNTVAGGLAAQGAGQQADAAAIDGSISTTQQANTVGISGHSSEVVLPDNTTIPAQWQIVDADQVSATLKEGVNQPRDRSRAASNVQVQGIANNPNYTLLRDSPVMDFGSPTISHDGAIVGGNGRFEGVSRAYDQGSATEYRAKLMADAASKGIDPASIEGMKKPVLVRRITQPFDTRALAVASNSGGSLQYSALEQAKIDGDRMQGIGDIEVNEVGDIVLTGDNMVNVRRALHGYTAAELGSLTDKDGKLSQEGMRRFKSALLYKAYGNSTVLSRMVESADPDLKSVMGALVRAAGSVVGVRADMESGSKPASADIVADLLSAVEQLAKIKAEGISLEQHIAQQSVFGREYSEASTALLRFMHDNIRSQKRMATFISSYYDGLAQEDHLSGSMFETAPATIKDRVSHAIQNASANDEAQGSSDKAAGQAGKQPETAQGYDKGDAESAQSPGVESEASTKADEDFTSALNDLGAIMRDVVKVQRITPEETQKLLPVLVRLFDAAFRKGYYDTKAAIKYVRGQLATHEATRKFAQFIPGAMMNEAVKTAADNMPAGFFDNQGMFAQSAQKAESKPAELALSSYSNADILKRESAAKNADEAAAKEAPAKAVTSDQVDMFSPQDSLFNSNRDGTQAAPVVVENHADLKQAEKQVDTKPTDAQKEAGNYTKGHIQWNGLGIAIENAAGSERSGTDTDGKKWSVPMPATYGYIKRTKGADGDHVDVYIGKEHQSDSVYVIDQKDANTGKFDEHKVMLGFANLGDAAKTYKAGFSDGKGAQRMGAIASMSLDQFKTWLDEGDTTKPAAKYTPPASEKQGGSLADALKQYEDTGEIVTVLDMANEVQRLVDEDIAPESLQAAVDTYRDELADSDKLKGRGDMDSADEALISAIRAAIAPVKKQAGEKLENATAPEHVESGDAGVTVQELKQIAKSFRDHINSGADGDVTHIFDAPAKSEIVRLQDKARVHVSGKGWMTPAEAKTEIAKWKDNAFNQYDNDKSRSQNNQRVVLSLFDKSGKWSEPWEEAGYQVYRFDIQSDPDMGDVNNFSTEFFNDWFGDFEGMDIYAVLAACPCTDFAVSGARHFAAKDEDGRTVSSVKLVNKTLATIEYFKPAVWALENPVGRIEGLTGLPPWRLSFDPNHLGDTYTKKTLIWGRFNGDLPIAPVEPTEGSKMHSQYGGKSMATKNARSVTPEGFAYGFFQANNAIDNPVLAIAGKYDRLDRNLIEQAVKAGVTEAEINDAVEDFYYQELDDAAANEAVRELTGDKAQAQFEPTEEISNVAVAQADKALIAINRRIEKLEALIKCLS